MPRNRAPSRILTLRVPIALHRSLEREARRRKRTASAWLRELIEEALAGGSGDEDPAREARRQSLLVSGRASEREALRFIERAVDLRGWK
jgi:hypothetical protein